MNDAIAIKKVDSYRVDTEEEAKNLLEDLRSKSAGYELTKHEVKMKTKKVKGEIVDSWYVLTVTFELLDAAAND
jgi:hypothetical protein